MSRNSARSRTCLDGLTAKAPFPGPAFGLLLLRGSGIHGETGLVATKPAANGALGGRVSSCPAVPCSSSAAPLPQLPVSLQPLLLVTALLWRAPGQPLETLGLHPLPLFLPYVSPCLPLSRNFPRKPWAQTGKEQGKDHMHCLGACVVW